MSTITGETTYQHICESLLQAAPRPYMPDFHIAQERWGWKVYDGDTPIACFTMQDGEYAFDWWQLSPFDAPVMANPQPPGAVYDLHTVHNTFLNLPVSRCGDLTEGVESIAEHMHTEWLQDYGEELRIRISGVFLHGQRIQYTLRFCYDPAQARYRFFVDAEMWKLEPTGGEPINMMLAGALTERGEDRRWTHSLWADSHDRLKRLVHSNALFAVTDYGDSSGRWRSKNGPTNGAWIAYAAHPTFNPAMLVHDKNVPVYFATCSQLFDEHLIWMNAGLDELDEGFFHFVMRTEFVNLPAALARKFLDAAADPPVPARWRDEKIALSFKMEVMNDFEARVDPWLPEDCPILVLPDASCWAEGTAHSGVRSITLTGTAFHGWQRLMPSGAVCRVAPGARYRLGGWVKTAKVLRFARLELFSYEYTYPNVIDQARSVHVVGDQDWTFVEVTLDTGEEAYIMPVLALYGTGVAWFDDLLLTRIG